MTHEEIRAALDARGFNLAMVAEALGVTPVAVGQVTARKSTSRRVAAAIAAALGQPITTVFPDIQSYQRDPTTTRRSARMQQLKATLQLQSA